MYVVNLSFSHILIFHSVIPLSIVGAHSFYTTLSNFLGLIGYWASAYIAIVFVEHLFFRKGDAELYVLSEWDMPDELPTGIPAIVAGCMGIGIAIPSMAQVWYTGPIAKTTGESHGFHVALSRLRPFRSSETLGQVTSASS